MSIYPDVQRAVEAHEKRLSLELARKEGRFYLQLKRLNRQGYDSAGRYYGTGSPLYAAWCLESGESCEVRANGRAEAKALVGAQFQGARFYR